MGVAERVGNAELFQEVHRNIVLAQRVSVQVQGALHYFHQIDPALSGRGRPREVGEVLDDLRCAPGLLLQHA